MDMLLQSQQKFLAGMEQIKEEAAERKKNHNQYGFYCGTLRKQN